MLDTIFSITALVGGTVLGFQFVMMLLGLLMSSAIPEAFGDKALLFAVPFVLIQLGRTVFTVWAMGRHWPENARNFARIAVWLWFGWHIFVRGWHFLLRA